MMYCYNDLKNSIRILNLRLDLIEKVKCKTRDINEKERLVRILNKLNEAVISIEDTMNKLKGEELEIYKNIVIRNMSITKAIEDVADKTYKDVGTIWRRYRRIKDYVEKLKMEDM